MSPPLTMMLHGSLDAKNFSLRTIHTPNATQAEPTSLGTQYAHICQNGSLDHKHSWGHPSFFLQPLFPLSVSYLFLPPSTVFFLHIGILVIVAMSSNLDPFLQVRLPYSELSSDALIADPWLPQLHIVNHIIVNYLFHALFIAPLSSYLHLLSSLLP